MKISRKTIVLMVCLLMGSLVHGLDDNRFRKEFFDYIIEGMEPEFYLYEKMMRAGSRVYLMNFPSLKTKHTQNEPDLFVEGLKTLKNRGIEIRVLHDSSSGLHPLVRSLKTSGVQEVYQINNRYDSVVEQGTQYAIIDDKVIVLKQKEKKPRILGINVDIQEYIVKYEQAFMEAKETISYHYRTR